MLVKVHSIAASTSSSLSSVPARLRMNNVELGRHGRSRSNVWNYRGVNTFGAGRMEELGSHPTSSPSRLLPMRCATVLGVATFAWILFRARGRPLRGQRRYVAHRQRRSDADRLDTVVDPVKRHSLPPRLLEMQGEFEKMRRGANCNRAKSGHFSITCIASPYSRSRETVIALAGTFRGETGASSAGNSPS
jgi:hypothetical protein